MKYFLTLFVVILAFSVSISAQAKKPKGAKPSARPATAPGNKTGPNAGNMNSGGSSAAKTAAACGSSNGLSQSEITAILDAHNKIRAALNLPKLTWNCGLADTAQTWAARGVFEHRTDTTYGENMFVSSNSAVNSGLSVDFWMTEKPSWNNTAGTCQPGKICTHYTQIVWRNTTEIGCGINRNAGGKWKVVMVCNYNPTGNSGGKAY